MTDQAETPYKFNVSMSCGGCSGAVKKKVTQLAEQQPDLGINVEQSQFLHDEKSKDVPNVFIAIDKEKATKSDYPTVLEWVSKPKKPVNWGEFQGQRQTA